MALLQRKSDDDKAADQERKAAAKAEADAAKSAERARKEHESFLKGPVGMAQTAYQRGDHLYIYDTDLMAQKAVIVSMVGSTTSKSTSDPSAILNAIAAEGWDLFSASTAFVHEGEQSRDKFMSSGQNVAVKGRLVAHYVFKRSESRQLAAAAA